jgi:hypothetical protein
MKAIATRVLAVFAVMAALVGVGAAPAYAATATATLFGNSCLADNGNVMDFLIVVEGRVHREYESGFYVVYRVWGDDPESDDLLAGPFTDGLFLGSSYRVGVCSFANSIFDEDWGTDEVYFGIRIFDRNTNLQTEVVESNRIVHDF